jgi:hypothetical protein
MSGVIGIFLLIISINHVSFQSYFLSLAENAPIYETKADARRTSPIILLILACNSTTFYPQRLFYPARPFTSFSAAVNLF